MNKSLSSFLSVVYLSLEPRQAASLFLGPCLHCSGSPFVCRFDVNETPTMSDHTGAAEERRRDKKEQQQDDEKIQKDPWCHGSTTHSAMHLFFFPFLVVLFRCVVLSSVLSVAFLFFLVKFGTCGKMETKKEATQMLCATCHLPCWLAGSTFPFCTFDNTIYCPASWFPAIPISPLFIFLDLLPSPDPSLSCAVYPFIVKG